VLEPDEGKLSSPVLRGLGASNGARPLGYLWTPTPGTRTELMLRDTQVPLSEIAAAMGFCR
jgi:hypothetical protein